MCPLPPRVWSVRYNHSHDQLVLTGSSDSRVTLSNMVSISSEPFGHLVDDDDLSDQEERRPEENLGRQGPDLRSRVEDAAGVGAGQP